MYCPFGIDIAYLMQVVRRIIHKLGVTPLYIQDTAHSHSVTMNQMWVKGDEWPDTLQWQEEEAQAEIPTLRIPLDKEGSDIMYSVIAPEPKFQAQLIYQAAVIMDAAGVNWTMPSSAGWDNSDMAMFTGDNEIMGRIKSGPLRNCRRSQSKENCHGRMRPRLPFGIRHGKPVARLGHAAYSRSSMPSSSTMICSRPAGSASEKICSHGHPARSLQCGAGRRAGRKGALRGPRHLRKGGGNAPQP
jgi:hypothetical protein